MWEEEEFIRIPLVQGSLKVREPMFNTDDLPDSWQTAGGAQSWSVGEQGGDAAKHSLGSAAGDMNMAA